MDPPTSPSLQGQDDAKSIPSREAYSLVPEQSASSHEEVLAPQFADLDLADWLDSMAPHAESSPVGTVQNEAALESVTQAIPGNMLQHIPAEKCDAEIDAGQAGGFSLDGLEDIFKLEAMETDEIQTAVETDTSGSPGQAFEVFLPRSPQSPEPGPCFASVASKASMATKDIQSLAKAISSTTLDVAEGLKDLIPEALPDYEIALRQAEAAEEALAGERVEVSKP